MRRDIVWNTMQALLVLMLAYVFYQIGYSAGGKAKLVKSDNATLIEGVCIDVVNNSEAEVRAE